MQSCSQFFESSINWE